MYPFFSTDTAPPSATSVDSSAARLARDGNMPAARFLLLQRAHAAAARAPAGMRRAREVASAYGRHGDSTEPMRFHPDRRALLVLRQRHRLETDRRAVARNAGQ
jgi:hypothetical protein